MPLLHHSYTEKTRAGANAAKFPLISPRTGISSQSRRQFQADDETALAAPKCNCHRWQAVGLARKRNGPSIICGYAV